MAIPVISKKPCTCGGRLTLFKTTKKEQYFLCEKCKKTWIVRPKEDGFLMTW